MADDSIEQKTLALVNEIRREYPNAADYTASHIALCRAIERHEAFKQEVSDAVVLEYRYVEFTPENLQRFIIPKPKPDPLADAIESVLSGFESRKHAESYAHHIRAELEARGFEIREKGQ
jgi:hypothetical protein